jgi:hypothetical protein
VLALLDTAVAAGADLDAAAPALSAVDSLLRGDAGIELTAGNLALAGEITRRLDSVDAAVDAV